MKDLRAIRTSHLEVTARPGESPEKLVKRFMRKVRNEGILREAVASMRFSKPSVKRRRKKLRALYVQRCANGTCGHDNCKEKF